MKTEKLMSSSSVKSETISGVEAENIRKVLNLPSNAQLSVETAGNEKRHQELQSTPQPPHKRGANENANPNQPQFEIHASAEAGNFFATNNISLILSAYKSNLVFAFGATEDRKLSCFYSVFPHPMAIGLSSRKDCTELWIACHSHLVRCSAVDSKYNDADEQSGGGGAFTATLVPRQLHAIGKQDVHSIYPLFPSAPFYVSTKYSALCQLDVTKPDVNVNVLWRPPFVSELRAEDRCHFNDVCWVDGQAKYATCICESDAHDGWRDHRQNGGVVVSIETGEIVTRGLSMPHSPRWYKNQLWLLNSGTGHLGTIDLTNGGRFEPKVFIPGFLRGLQFFGRFAIVGSSLDRHERRFQDLELGKNLDTKKTTPICGFFVIDLTTLTIEQKIEIKGNIHEIYDIALVPTRRVRILGMNDESVSWEKIVDNQPAIMARSAAALSAGKKDDDENEEEK